LFRQVEQNYNGTSIRGAKTVVMSKVRSTAAVELGIPQVQQHVYLGGLISSQEATQASVETHAKLHKSMEQVRTVATNVHPKEGLHLVRLYAWRWFHFFRATKPAYLATLAKELADWMFALACQILDLNSACRPFIFSSLDDGGAGLFDFRQWPLETDISRMGIRQIIGLVKSESAAAWTRYLNDTHLLEAARMPKVQGFRQKSWMSAFVDRQGTQTNADQFRIAVKVAARDPKLNVRICDEPTRQHFNPIDHALVCAACAGGGLKMRHNDTNRLFIQCLRRYGASCTDQLGSFFPNAVFFHENSPSGRDKGPDGVIWTDRHTIFYDITIVTATPDRGQSRALEMYRHKMVKYQKLYTSKHLIHLLPPSATNSTKAQREKIEAIQNAAAAEEETLEGFKSYIFMPIVLHSTGTLLAKTMEQLQQLVWPGLHTKHGFMDEICNILAMSTVHGTAKYMIERPLIDCAILAKTVDGASEARWRTTTHSKEVKNNRCVPVQSIRSEPPNSTQKENTEPTQHSFSRLFKVNPETTTRSSQSSDPCDQSLPPN